MKRRIELLAPARTADIGIEAIRHGADAVYIGAPRFGARAAAVNGIDDIRRLCEEAHLFDARVYVAFNTILYDDELADAERLIHRLYEAGADALIVQDTAVLGMDIPPIALHASTQMDVATPGKAAFLERAGFSQLVLARELSLAQIRAVRAATHVELEAFVHGALCVSYSGRCYASCACFGRSANRGECAQFCRLPFDLVDAQGRTLQKERHLLSLRDMNRSASLEEMMDAGISSFKIEGRLKGMDYVKNITAYYRRAIDAVLARRTDDYERSSHGSSELRFEPRAEKSFNRGFTDYFLHGRNRIDSFESPKSRGEYVGTVAAAGRRSFTLADAAVQLHAGDGLCYIDEAGRMQGLRVNRVEGREVFPAKMPYRMPAALRIYRNQDYAFVRLLEGPTAERRLRLRWELEATDDGFVLRAVDETGRLAEVSEASPLDEARTPQDENIRRVLSKCGDTPFRVEGVSVTMQGHRFLPASRLAEARRKAVAALLHAHAASYVRPSRAAACLGSADCGAMRLGYEANVANRAARAFYAAHGATDIAPAFEKADPKGEVVLMTCKHCLRYALGACPRERHGRATTWSEPLFLRLADGRRFPLRFDCRRCEMQVLAGELPLNTTPKR